MSEIITTPETLGEKSPPPTRHLRGNLGVASIVFMVVAAAAPLGVIGGVVPLGLASGNGAGFPATFVASTVILLLFAVGFTALTPYVEEAGAFFSYVRKSLGFPTGIGIAFVALVSYVAIEAGVYGLLGPAGAAAVELFGGPSLPWWLFAALAFAVTTYLGYRNIQVSSRVLAVLLTAEIAIVAVLDLVIVAQGGDHGLSNGIVNPNAIFSGLAGHRTAVRTDQLCRIRGHRDLPRRGAHTRAHHSARHLRRADPHRRVLRRSPAGRWSRGGVTRKPSGGRPIRAAPSWPTRATRYIGVVGTDIITVLYFTSLFACILAFHNVASRYVFALSQRDVLPESLELCASPPRLTASGVAVDLRGRRGEHRAGRGVQPRPGRAVLHLVRRRHHGRLRRAVDRHLGCGAGVLRPRPARPLAVAGRASRLRSGWSGCSAR